MSNCRVIEVEVALPNQFCEGYTTEVARTSEGRFIAAVERACLMSAAPVADLLVMNDGTVEAVYFCRAHHSLYQEAK